MKKHYCLNCDGFGGFGSRIGVHYKVPVYHHDLVCDSCNGKGYFLDEDLEQEMYMIDRIIKGLECEYFAIELAMINIELNLPQGEGAG